MWAHVCLSRGILSVKYGICFGTGIRVCVCVCVCARVCVCVCVCTSLRACVHASACVCWGFQVPWYLDRCVTFHQDSSFIFSQINKFSKLTDNYSGNQTCEFQMRDFSSMMLVLSLMTLTTMMLKAVLSPVCHSRKLIRFVTTL